MARQNVPLLALNRGEVSLATLARVDIDRLQWSAEICKNWIPKTQGSAIFRPGMKYLGSTKNDTGAVLMDFVASTTQVNLLELTPTTMRIWASDALLTRESRTTTISDFSVDTGVWTYSEVNDGSMRFNDTGLVLNAKSRGGNARAYARVALGDTGQLNKEHNLMIQVGRGPVNFRVGKDDTGDDSYIKEAVLYTGYHSLAFTPTDTGEIHIMFSTQQNVDRMVKSISFGDTGTIEVTTPWSATDLPNIRWTQSADVMYVACANVKPMRIERRTSGRSWSVVEYLDDVVDGPFIGQTSQSVRLKVDSSPSPYFGNTTMSSDVPFFKETHVGAIFELYLEDYEWEFRLAGTDVYTDAITVNGVEDKSTTHERDFQYRIQHADTGPFSATLNLQITTGDKTVGPWISSNAQGGVSTINITDTGTFQKADDTENYELNNIKMYARVKMISHTKNAAIVKFKADGSNNPGYKGGGDYGIVKVTGFQNSKLVDVEVVTPPPTDSYSSQWREGAWSSLQGYPTDVAIYEGRLFWAGRSSLHGSVPDDFKSFSDAIEGASAPLYKTIGEGPVDNVVFSIGLQQLLLGTVGSVISVKADSFDSALTVDNTTAKIISTYGAANVRAIRSEGQAVFVGRSKNRLYGLYYNDTVNNYTVRDLTLYHPDILYSGGNGCTDIAVQKTPDVRVHCVLANGQVALLTFEPTEELMAWSRVETDGSVEAVVVLPATGSEDSIYYLVNRTINGVTKRYIEKWEPETNAVGGTVNRMADSYITRSVSDGDTGSKLTGLSHLEAKTVSLWRDGKDRGTFTVSSGAITDTGSSAGDTGVIGLVYTGDYKTAKLAFAAQFGTALLQPKRVDRIGLYLVNTHHKGITYGGDSGNLDDMPDMLSEGSKTDTGTIFEVFDQQSFTMNGIWSTDSRLFLRATAPRPATVAGVVVSLTTEENL